MAGLILLAALFVVAGVMHLVSPGPFVRIVPPMLPFREALVAISGVAEILGGVGLLIPRVRRYAAYGLVLLLIAVFPANIYMAVAHVAFNGWAGQAWFQWVRLPFQFALIAWAWKYRGDSGGSPSRA